MVKPWPALQTVAGMRVLFEAFVPCAFGPACEHEQEEGGRARAARRHDGERAEEAECDGEHVGGHEHDDGEEDDDDGEHAGVAGQHLADQGVQGTWGLAASGVWG